MAVAALVPKNAHVIDVGTDHAMLPVYLAQTGGAEHIWASDLREGPLRSASRLVEEMGTGDRVGLRLTDGLQGFTRTDGDTVVIAGMGGETMVSILSGAEWIRDNVLLILEPQSKQAVLRRWLTDSGFCIQSERLVQDAGRIYPIMTATAGKAPVYTEAEYHTGLLAQIGMDPLFSKYLRSLQKRADTAAPYDREMQLLADAYRKMEGEIGRT